MPKNLLEQLRTMTTVVADTGDIEAIEKVKPQDATTNPSLITAAAQMPQYAPIVDGVLMDAKKRLGEDASDQDVAKEAFKHLAIAFGKKILAIIPGRVSTEVDARLSYDTEKTLKQARDIIALYAEQGISKERILIKIASTWEGKRGNSLQSDAAVWHSSSGCLRRCKGDSGFTLRRTYSRLVQKGHGQGLSGRRRSRRAVGDEDIQLLQKVRLQNTGDGREFPQYRRNPRAGRMRPADHLADSSSRAGVDSGGSATKARSGKGEVNSDRETEH